MKFTGAVDFALILEHRCSVHEVKVRLMNDWVVLVLAIIIEDTVLLEQRFVR
jgi:hypothetical protein